MPGAEDVRRFRLNRIEDASGVSGTGIVAEGVEFSNGMVAVCFLTGPATEGHRSIIAYWSLDAVEAVHGHDGKTVVEWVTQDEQSALLVEADSHVSWCRHRHPINDDHARELDEWILRARRVEKDGPRAGR